VLAEVAKFIELGMVTAADHTGIGGQGGRLVGDGAFQPIADVSEFVDFLMKLTKQFAAARGLRRKKFFSTGSWTSDLRSATSSRGVASPSVIRLVSRSRSRMPLSSLRISPRTTVCCTRCRRH